MHFRFALDSADIDLWNIDLLDAYLDLLDTISPVNILFLSNSPGGRLEDMFSRRLQEVFKIRRRLQLHNFSSSKTSSRRLQDILEDKKLLGWRHVEDVFKTCLEDVLKTSWRLTIVSWDISGSGVIGLVSNLLQCKQSLITFF